MNVYERIVERLKEEPLLREYKYEKTRDAFIRLMNGVEVILSLRVSNAYDWFKITPLVSVYYPELNEWYEPFSVGPMKEWRSGSNRGTGADASCFWPAGNYSLWFEQENIDDTYGKLLQDIEPMLEYVQDKFVDKKYYYNFAVKPLITGKRVFPGSGARWLFEYLAACRAVAPKSYPKLKDMVVELIRERATWDPDIWMSEGKWDEIFATLESHDFHRNE